MSTTAPPNQFADCADTYELLGVLAGAASVCWENVREAGVFDSVSAGRFVGDAHRRLEELTAVRERALRVDLAGARRINDNQRRDIERLQNELRTRGDKGWGNR